jgi:hypothetical protein
MLRSLASSPDIESAEATEVLSIASLKFRVMVALAVTPVVPFNGDTEVTVGGVVSGVTQAWLEQV